jgi:hypothetical protein
VSGQRCHSRQRFPVIPLALLNAPSQILNHPFPGSLFTARHFSMIVPSIILRLLFMLYALLTLYTMFN